MKKVLTAGLVAFAFSAVGAPAFADDPPKKEEPTKEPKKEGGKNKPKKGHGTPTTPEPK